MGNPMTIFSPSTLVSLIYSLYHYHLVLLILCNFNTASKIWSRPRASGEVITARFGHSSSAFEKNIYFFGGNDGSKFLNELYVFATSKYFLDEEV
jgi:hypothetical protein